MKAKTKKKKIEEEKTWNRIGKQIDAILESKMHSLQRCHKPEIKNEWDVTNDSKEWT